MPRIYKGTETDLKLFLKRGSITNVNKIIFYTTDTANTVSITDNIVVDENQIKVEVKPTSFERLEDGVVSYIVYGNGAIVERQSDYYLKTPISNPTTGLQLSKSQNITENGNYIIKPDQGYKGIVEVKVDVDVKDFDSYNNGFNDGKREQKSLLTTISITENGTYSKEDGYNEVIVEVPDLNGSYDEGYQDGYDEGIKEGTENAGAAVAETAQILETTIEGTYTTKYSKPEDITEEITGDFGDGTYFYGYATTYDRGYNTEIEITKTTVVEFWYNPSHYKSSSYIIRTDGGANEVYVQRSNADSLKFHMRLIEFTVPIEVKNKFYHIKMSQPDGVFIDGKKVGDFTGSGLNMGKFFIWGGYNIGMVKIDNNIFIPKEDGFINYVTNEILFTSKPDQGYYQYYNPIISTNGNLIRTVVNRPKINVEKYGIKLGYSTFTEIPDCFDISNIIDMSTMFGNCSNLKTIPPFDSSITKNMSRMFEYCNSLTSIPQLNTSQVTNIGRMFYNCSSLTNIPQLDTSNVTDMSRLFDNCSALISVPPLNAESVTTSGGIFGYSNITTLTDFGGLIGLKASMTDNYSFQKVPNLTYESCINILNGLYDFTGNGETPSSNQGKLKVHQNFLNLVGEEISIGVQKGWLIQV